MHRTRRVSRPLIAALAVVIVIGSIFYLHHVRSAQAAAVKQTTPPAIPNTIDASLASDVHHADAPPVDANTASVIPSPLVTQTPGVSQADAGNAPASSAVPAPAPSAKSDPSIPATKSPSVTAKPVSTPANPPAGSSVAAAPVAPASPVILSGTPLADAKAKSDAGQLVAARDILNAALSSGKLSTADADSARTMAGEISKTLIFSPKRFSDDPYALAYPVQSGEKLSTIAAKNGLSWEILSKVNGIEPRRLRSGTTIKVIKGPFYAVVSKSLFRLDVYLGSPDGPNVFVQSMPVGLGKDGSTPTGTWQVEQGNKIRHPKYYSPRGEGVLDADDPKNPLNGYWIGLAGLDGQAVGKTSYGVHGTIDPNSIGKQESMGCIRLRADDIALLFDLLVEGKSKVIVKD